MSETTETFERVIDTEHQLQSRMHVPVRAFGMVDSTMFRARAWVKEGGAESFQVVIAEQQHAGRGRRGRTWISSEKGLYCTCISRVPVAATALAGLSLLVGLCTVQVLNGLVPNTFVLKWPNDVLAKDGRKISGTLIEVVEDARGDSFVLIGVGLNCATFTQPLLHACALQDFLSKPVSPEDLCVLLVSALQNALPQFYSEGFATFAAAWTDHALYMRQKVAIVDEGDRVEGEFIGVRDDGALLLKTGVGTRAISVGDVEAV